MKIDTSFNMYSDAGGGDPDSTSPTLKSYHQFLWSKELPNGKKFHLSSSTPNSYLHHKSELGEFFLGSDAITHSYKNHERKKWLTEQISDEVQELFDIGSTIGAYTLFPNKRVNKKHTINQARGVKSIIDDRFDLTLECIQRFYKNDSSPLQDTILRYNEFFNLFESFEGYVDYFLLNDLVDRNYKVKFYLPFDQFQTKPEFKSIEDYREYKKGVIEFINLRNKRIEKYLRSLNSSKR